MGQCICGAELCSTGEAAGVQNVVPGRIRNIAHDHPAQLAAGKLGWFWVFSREAVGNYSGNGRNHAGPPNGNGAGPVCNQCPVCGVRLWSTQQAAPRLGITQSGVQAALAANPADLLAFRVGRFWVVPEPGIAQYRRLREQARQREEAEQDLVDAVRELLAAREQLAALAGDDPAASLVVRRGTTEVQVTVTYKAATCNCGVYRNARGQPFPHRPGSGRCQADPLLGAAILNCSLKE